MTQESFRLNQAIAKTGACSRRKADELIRDGQVKVNGKVVCDFNFLVDFAKDKLTVCGKALALHGFDYVALNKPRGIVTTCADDLGRKGILFLLPASLRHLRPVGRLDMDSEGLIILTNDGDLTQMLTHPSAHLPKTYVVSVKGKIMARDIALLKSGIVLEDGKTLPCQASILEQDRLQSSVHLVLQEGRNRQIRRMFAQLGYPVISLVRTAIGRLQLGQMGPGSWRFLSGQELKLLTSKHVEQT